METGAVGGGEERPEGAAPFDLRSVRTHLAPLFFAAAFLVLGAVNLVGLVGRAPVVAAGIVLVITLSIDVVRAALRAVRRALWKISSKLIISYVLIAVGPALFLFVVFLVFTYLAAGQFIALVAWNQIAELTDEVDATCVAVADELTLQATQAVDFEEMRERGEVGVRSDALLGLSGRFENVVARGVIFSTSGDERYVPIGFEWPGGVRAEKPDWLVGPEFETQLVVGRGGLLEIKGAVHRLLEDREIYVEVSLPLGDETLEVLKRYVGTDLRILQPQARGSNLGVLATTHGPELNRSGWMNALPVFGVLFVNPVSWSTGEAVNEGRLVVTQRTIGGLYRDIYGFRAENRVLIVSVLILVLISLVLLETVSLVVGVSLARSITGSLHELFQGTRLIEKGELSHRIAIHAPDQLGELSRSFNRMAESVEELVRESATRERLEEELRIGRRIQQSLLPPRLWNHDRFEIAAYSLPAKEVGGDYYDFFTLDDDRVGMLVADVSGKGTEAAFYMAEVKGVMLAVSRRNPTPAEALDEANALLSESLDRRTFVTMAYAVLDLPSSVLSFGRAGHSPLLHLPSHASVIESHVPSGISLGVDRKGGFRAHLEQQEIELGKDDLTIFFTDGVTETFDAGGDCYGQERLEAAVIESRHKNAEAVCDALVADLRSFAGDVPMHDDLTLIVMRTL